LFSLFPGFFQGFFGGVKQPQKLNLELSFETRVLKISINFKKRPPAAHFWGKAKDANQLFFYVA
jgi:hypothetical protein